MKLLTIKINYFDRTLVTIMIAPTESFHMYDTSPFHDTVLEIKHWNTRCQYKIVMHQIDYLDSRGPKLVFASNHELKLMTRVDHALKLHHVRDKIIRA